MNDRILIPTDGSIGTAHVAMHGIDLAEKYGGSVYVVYVIDTSGSLLGETTEPSTERKRIAEQAVKKIEAIARAHDVPTETTIRQGKPADEILDYAEEIDADAIVAGTHGRTGVRRRVIGSVAERLVRHANCPVTTIRLPETDETIETAEGARERATAAIESDGYEATITGVEDQNHVWVVDAETDDGSLLVYIDPVTQRTRVLERN